MKRALPVTALLLAAAGYVCLQTAPPAPDPATLMPSGALLYLEAPDFGRLLRDWDASRAKADWLASDNYAVFSRSNLFSKLSGVYSQYGAAAGFFPGIKSVTEIAGSDSALALYGLRDVEFLYVSRIADADLMKSQLWAVRDKFERRQAGGVSFFQRTDPASRRTVAFAFSRSHLFLATRTDLLAQALELLAGGAGPSLASDRWYREAVAAAQGPGELRLAMNLDALVKTAAFRSYWVQGNGAAVRRYWAGVADVKRSGGNITESRVLLHAPSPASGNSAAVSSLLALVPPEAGLYKAWGVEDSSEAAALIVAKLIAPSPARVRDWRAAPAAPSPDSHAGSEGDLETRIDEQPLAEDAGIAGSMAAARALVNQAGAHALLLVQSSAPAEGTFVPMSSTIVLAGAGEWDRDSVRNPLSSAAGKLWTTSQLGAGWVGETAGRHSVERLDGLGTLMFAIRGRLLFLANDSRLLAATLDRVGTAAPAEAFTYAAGFRHSRERANFERIMAALDFAGSTGDPEDGQESRAGAPAFFSRNIGSLSRALSKVAEVRVTEEERGAATLQTVVYRLGQ